MNRTNLLVLCNDLNYMDNEERQHLEILLQTHRRNLRLLERQAAQYGSLAVPVSIISQIEHEQAEISRLKRLLERDLSQLASEISAQQTENWSRKRTWLKLLHKHYPVWTIIVVVLVVAGAASFLVNNPSIWNPQSQTSSSAVQSESTMPARPATMIVPNPTAIAFVQSPVTLTMPEPSATPNPAPPATPSPTPSLTPIPFKERIAFVSGDLGNQDLYIINPDGRGQTLLARGMTSRSDPAWSPDGQYIALALDQGSTTNIYVRKADGTGSWRSLTNIPGRNHAPAWSPDGKHIAFRSDREEGWNIFIVDAADGNNLRLLSDRLKNAGYPSWSPDGKYIAFEADWDGDYDIYKMNLSSEEIIPLTDNEVDDGTPFWSPNGDYIAFVRQNNEGKFIWVMNSDGSGAYRISQSPEQLLPFQSRPTWSPDSQYIAFSSERDGNIDIYKIKANGGEGTETRVTSNVAADFSPAWSP